MRVLHNFSLLRFVFFVYAIWIFPLHVYFLIITWLVAQRREITVLIKALIFSKLIEGNRGVKINNQVITENVREHTIKQEKHFCIFLGHPNEIFNCSR